MQPKAEQDLHKTKQASGKCIYLVLRYADTWIRSIRDILISLGVALKPRGEYQGFQVTGMIEGFFWV